MDFLKINPPTKIYPEQAQPGILKDLQLPKFVGTFTGVAGNILLVPQQHFLHNLKKNAAPSDCCHKAKDFGDTQRGAEGTEKEERAREPEDTCSAGFPERYN